MDIKLSQLLYDSLVYEKTNTGNQRLYGRKKRDLLTHIQLWNLICPIIISADCSENRYRIALIEKLVNSHKMFDGEVSIKNDFDSDFSNSESAEMLVSLICLLNAEMCNKPINYGRVHMLIRVCHNLPRSLLDGDMHVSENDCIEYSFANMDKELKAYF